MKGKPITERIIREGGMYVVKGESSDRSFGKYPTMAAARKRLQQMEFFKSKGARTKKTTQESKAERLKSLSSKVQEVLPRKQPRGTDKGGWNTPHGQKFLSALKAQESLTEAIKNHRKGGWITVRGRKLPVNEKGEPLGNSRAAVAVRRIKMESKKSY